MDSNYPTFFSGLNCNGTEDDIFKCSVDPNVPVCVNSFNDANVICPGMYCMYLNILLVITYNFSS